MNERARWVARAGPAVSFLFTVSVGALAMWVTWESLVRVGAGWPFGLVEVAALGVYAFLVWASAPWRHRRDWVAAPTAFWLGGWLFNSYRTDVASVEANLGLGQSLLLGGVVTVVLLGVEWGVRRLPPAAPRPQRRSR